LKASTKGQDYHRDITISPADSAKSMAEHKLGFQKNKRVKDSYYTGESKRTRGSST